MKPNLLKALLLMAVLGLAACTLNATPAPVPSATPIPEGAVETAIAQTIEARSPEQLPTATEPADPDAPTEPPAEGDPPTEVPTFTDIPANSNTPTATEPTGVCDQATFVVDVTIPDGTEIQPGAAFTKTWRLQNTGTCTWTTDYDLIFWNGDQMGGPGSQALAHSVAPGHTIDISVNLTGPTTNGTYKGNWKLRNASGEAFSLPSGNPFYVQILIDDHPTPTKTPTATPTIELPPAIASITLRPYTATTAFSNGTVYGGIIMAGDGADDVGFQAVVAFDLSEIPAGASIENVALKYPGRALDGNPFDDLNWLDISCGSYLPFTSTTGAYGSWVHRFNSASQLGTQISTNTLRNLVIGGCGSGSDDLQFLFHWNVLAKMDGAQEWISFPTVELQVTYTLP